MGYTTEEMQEKFRYESWNSWDFTTVWAICEGTNYPRLRWQIPKGDIACPDGVDIADFAHLAAWWDRVDCGTQNNCEGADLDTDGSVDINDFAILVADWLAGA